MSIQKIDRIPVTETSWPMGRAAVACRLAEAGYAEDEYFVTGTARIYREAAHGKAEVICEGAPYTDRVLIRRPEDPARFSGNVVIEILNSTAGLDIDRIWINCWKYMLRHGDIYVGITSRGNVTDALQAFDPERYAPLSWANPLPGRAAPEGAPTSGPFRFRADQEMGLVWDILEDTAQLLASEDEKNPIRAYPGRRLFLTGWSQSTSYIARYLKTFYDEARPLYAGYLSAGGGCVPMGLNACEPQVPPFRCDGTPVGSVMGAAEPVITINTESENRAAFWYGDFDEPSFKLRTYQIPGSSHDSRYNLFEYYAQDPLMNAKTPRHRDVQFIDGQKLDFPYEPIFCAALRNLFAWANDDIPAPHAEKIETNILRGRSRDPIGSDADNLSDAFGNTRGGVRSPAIDYPLGTYCSYGTHPDGSVSAMLGKVNYFPADMLKALYGDLANYHRLAEGSADQMIAKGFLLRADKAELVERCVAAARRCGLE